MSTKIKRSVYADMFGPTTGDKVRLADTDLIIEVEKDFTTYGEEVKFGGGKVIRDGMGQSQATNKQGAADTVISPTEPLSARFRHAGLPRVETVQNHLFAHSVCDPRPFYVQGLRQAAAQPFERELPVLVLRSSL